MFRSIIRYIIWLFDYNNKKTTIGNVGSFLIFLTLVLIAMLIAGYALAIFSLFFRIPMIDYG